MNSDYPYVSPVVITDAIFYAYGGHTGTSTSAQRQAAFLIAEMAASYDLETLLIPTTVTGTYSWQFTAPIITDWAHVNSVSRVRFIDVEENAYYTNTTVNSDEWSIRNDEYGIIDLHAVYGNCNCSHMGYPYKVEVVYNAGFPTGTSNRADVLLALTTYSDIILNEIVGYGNEAPGDIGVKSFSNQQYSENRVAMLRTAYGSSARGQFAHGLLTKLRKYRHVGL